MDSYREFLESKALVAIPSGVRVTDDDIHPLLFPFQRDLVRWSLRHGRAALFADCGLGKTLMQLEFLRLCGAERSLIFAPLSVAQQTIREAAKLDILVSYVARPSEMTNGVSITNYDLAKHFDAEGVDALVLDESSILKSVDSKTRKLMLTRFCGVPFKLCCTATPCPNDIAELANHAEFLEVMTRQEMLGAFFVHDQNGWRLRGHASDAFYRWVASWSMSLKAPSDLGYEDDGFILPELCIRDCVVETDIRSAGRLFPGGLSGITERASVRRGTFEQRCRAAAEIIRATDGQAIAWCGLNDESSRMAELLDDDAVEIYGSLPRDEKVARITAFIDGEYRVLVTKPKIAGFGMNFQNAATMVFVGLSDSYETYYQCIRRCWRFGQRDPVDVYVVTTDHEAEIPENVRRKEAQAEELSRNLLVHVREFEMAEIQEQASEEAYEAHEMKGDGWVVRRGDCVEEMRKMPDGSVDLSVFSPPFLSLYTYTDSDRDMGNSRDVEAFFQHFGFAIEELLRITRPGRIACVHVAQVATKLVTHGVIGLQDFRGMVIEAFKDRGWVFHGEICIDKNPQAQAIRTHAKGLLFVQKSKDASWLRPGLADFVLLFRAPGENEVPILPDVTNDEWIQWAHPVWYDIQENATLNTSEARSEKDDRHICPLQLPLIARCVRLWSNPGETVFSPFAGIGSEGYVALRHGRMFIGIELKALYAEVAARNCERALGDADQPRLFSVDAETMEIVG